MEPTVERKGGKKLSNESSKKSSKKCQALKPNGRNCDSNAMLNSQLCFFHDPATREQRKAAQRTGGRNRAREIRVLPPDTPNRSLSTDGEVSALIDEMINRLLRGELDTSIAREVTRMLAVRRLYDTSAQDDNSVAIITERLHLVRSRLGADGPEQEQRPADLQ